MATVASVPAYLLPGVPVVHPPHLEGDPSLATEILPGPPSLQSVQQTANRKDAKKPTSFVSYLPVSDPGSTYAGLAVAGALAAPMDPDEPRRKRARTERGSMNRAQRASARSLNAAPAPLSSPPPGDEPVASSSQVYVLPEADGVPPPPEEERPSLSRDNSDMNIDDVDSASTNGRSRTTRNKGKAKEKASVVRVKEEPVTMSISMFDNYVPRQPNEDHCSSCRTVASGGGLVYCDSCPRAFHFVCLDPPINPAEVGDGDWFCPSCVIRQNPTPKPIRSFMAPLIQQVQSTFPVEFHLPDDIRGFFRDVGSDPRGTYLDTSQIKQPRLDRHGRPEERDPYRLRDRNGAPVICFQCGKSALPEDDATQATASKRPRRVTTIKSVNAESGRSIISCDYCDLHWHLDCMDPPMATVPTFGKKWMCPAHADQVLPPKRRIPKQHNTPIEITRPNQKNNGNVEIIQSETPAAAKIATDDVTINGRRYRIPERIITLDFWSKLSRVQMKENDLEDDSSMSTLTSLSSDEEEVTPAVAPEPATRDSEELRLAQLLCELKYGMVHHRKNGAGISIRNAASRANRKLTSVGIQTDAAKTAEIGDGMTMKGLLNGKHAPAVSASVDAKQAKPLPAKRREAPKAPASIHLDSSLSTPSASLSVALNRPPVPAFSEPSVPATSTSISAPPAQRPRGRPRKTPAAGAAAKASASRRGRTKAAAAASTASDVQASTTNETSIPQTPKLKQAPSVAATAATPSTSTSGNVATTSSTSDLPRSSSSLKIRLPRLSGINFSTPSITAAVDAPNGSPSSMAPATNGQVGGVLPTPPAQSSRPRRTPRTTSARGSPSASSSARRSGRAKRGAPSALASPLKQESSAEYLPGDPQAPS